MSCNDKIPAITRNEQNVQFWSHVGCLDRQSTYGEKVMYGLYGEPIGPDDIDSVYVPPHMEVVAYNHDMLKTSDPGSWVNKYVNTASNRGMYANLNDSDPIIIQGNKIGINDINSFEIIKKYPWEQHLAYCCAGSDKVSPEQCGNYWGKGDSGVCDSFLEKDWCPTHKDDPLCGCYVEKDLANETNEAIRLNELNKACSSTCGMSVNAYKPMNIRGMQCNVTNNICQQAMNLRGDSNLLKNVISSCEFNGMGPGSANTVNNGSNSTGGTSSNETPSTSTDVIKNNEEYSYMLYLLIGVLVLIIIYNSMKPTNFQNSGYQYPGYQYPGYQQYYQIQQR